MNNVIRKKKTNHSLNTSMLKIICLLLLVGIFFIVPAINAHAIGDFDFDDLANESTFLNPSGSANNPEDLGRLNTANRFTVAYDGEDGQLSGSLRIMLILTFISLVPFLLITMSAFVRIVIVLHFTRAALNTQSAPPNQVLMTMALFLTFFIMQPVINEIYNNAFIPFDAAEIGQEEFFTAVMEPIREFMYIHTQKKDVNLFITISNTEWDGQLSTIPSYVLIPSFIISELRTAFMIGFIIYIPFVVIDMVIASTLMAMGMMMLPPTVISMPFKILLFVLADGWHLIVGSLVKTFY
ncbi:MAG: flagellar type III secretion system pore protein FliP [Lachnospiraceae bacterium]|nr:flagellar type III secretion system pore protein FliP [Lachnospiraceae bacterium]